MFNKVLKSVNYIYTRSSSFLLACPLPTNFFYRVLVFGAVRVGSLAFAGVSGLFLVDPLLARL